MEEGVAAALVDLLDDQRWGGGECGASVCINKGNAPAHTHITRTVTIGRSRPHLFLLSGWVNLSGDDVQDDNGGLGATASRLCHTNWSSSDASLVGEWRMGEAAMMRDGGWCLGIIGRPSLAGATTSRGGADDGASALSAIPLLARATAAAVGQTTVPRHCWPSLARWRDVLSSNRDLGLDFH